MESGKIYESSYKELNSIKKNLSSEKITIDFNKLDTVSAGVIRDALSNSVRNRLGAVYSVITSQN